MTERKKLLHSGSKKDPLLQGKKETCRSTKRRKLSLWYKLYLSTTLAVVILSATFLISATVKEASPDKRSFTDTVAEFVLKLSFGDLFGDNTEDTPPSNTTTTPDILVPPGSFPSSPSQGTNAPTQDTQKNDIYAFDYSKVPENEKAIIPMDLSLSEYGNTYIHNSTGYAPDTNALLSADLKSPYTPIAITSSNEPLVLILHTHGTEAYSDDNAISYSEDDPNYARSNDTAKNVVAIGEIVANTLKDAGIPAIHCTIPHDSLQYKDSYKRAEETIKEYLNKYPSIKLVIDIHRDAVVKSSGELVRPITSVDSEETAQVMCVVGSDWAGEACPNWEGNLALALKLRDSLNKKYSNICRPTYLRTSTYNQELAPFSLLLEIGASGNSLKEAKRAAVLVAEELAPLILSI